MGHARTVLPWPSRCLLLHSHYVITPFRYRWCLPWPLPLPPLCFLSFWCLSLPCLPRSAVPSWPMPSSTSGPCAADSLRPSLPLAATWTAPCPGVLTTPQFANPLRPSVLVSCISSAPTTGCIVQSSLVSWLFGRSGAFLWNAIIVPSGDHEGVPWNTKG